MNKTQCPLCKALVATPYLSPIGTCMFCADNIDSYKAQHVEDALAREEHRLSIASQHVARIKKLKVQGTKRLEQEQKQKTLDEEAKRLSDIHKEQASIALAKRSLLHYIERRKPNYKTDWIHEDIARRIEKFMYAVERGESPRLILEICPRVGKSELASDSGPAWILGHHPEWDIVVASYAINLPMDWSRSVRDQLRSEDYRQIFPSGARIKKDDAGAESWSTEQGGGYKAVGVGGGLLGHGANLLILDDLIKGDADAQTPTALDKVWSWVTTTAMSRLMPLSGVLVIAQRWNISDVIGRFERKMDEELKEVARLRREAKEHEEAGNYEEAEKCKNDANDLDEAMDKWEVIKYPALAIDDEYLTEEGDIIRVPEQVKVRPEWRLLRTKGESIHPKRFSRAYYINKKRLNPTFFNAMYQQEPLSEEGAYFSPSDFQRRYPVGKYPKLETCNVMCAWDLAISTSTSADYTVGIAGAQDYNGDIYLLELVKGRFGDAYEISDLIIDLHTRWKAGMTGIEHMMISMTLGPVLKRRMQERSQYITLAEGKEALKTGNQDKKLRARGFQALCRAGKVLTPEGEKWDEYIAHMTQFGAGQRHDDEVDASAWLGIMFGRTQPPRNPKASLIPEKIKSWWDEMVTDMTGDRGSYMES